MAAYCDMKDRVEIAYLVDADTRLFGPRGKSVQDRTGDSPKCVQDLRKALDDKDLDAVSIATPNHWHSLQAIWACQAGKDVYVEKPCSHNVFEGRKLVEAAQKYDRIVQMGSQSRSDPYWINQVAAVRSGKYGKLLISYGYASKPRRSIGFKKAQAAAQGVGFRPVARPGAAAAVPRERRALQLALVLGFRQRRDRQPGRTPDGYCPLGHARRRGAQERHQPRRPLRLQGPRANAQHAVDDHRLRRPEALLRGPRIGRREDDESHQRVLHGRRRDQERPVLPQGQDQGRAVGERRRRPRPAHRDAEGRLWEGGEPRISRSAPAHFANFIDCVRNRTPDKLNAPVLEGHLSSLLCSPGQHFLPAWQGSALQPGDQGVGRRQGRL